MRARPAGPAQSSALHNRPPSTIPPGVADKGDPSTALDVPAEHHQRSGPKRRRRDVRPKGMTRLLPLRRQHSEKHSLTWGFGARGGFEPSTFRLRVGPKSSNWTRPGPSWLLRSGTDFIQCRPVPADSNAWVAKEVATPPGLARVLPSVRRLDHPIASEGHSSETSMVLRSPNTLSPPSVTSPGGRGADDPVSDQLKGPSACRPVLRAEASIHPSSTAPRWPP